MELPKGLDPKVADLFFEKPIEIMDVCTKCLKSKPISEFPVRGKNGKTKRGQCKQCRSAYIVEWQKKNPEKTRERINAWREKNRDIIREKYRERNRLSAQKYRAEHPEWFQGWMQDKRCRKYGVTKEWLAEQVEKQNGLCAICGGPPNAKGLCIDHCHETGQVRDLLCGPCNTSLHKMERDIGWIHQAEAYLRKHGKE